MSEDNSKTIEAFNKIKNEDLKKSDEGNRGFIILIITIIILFIVLGFYMYYQPTKTIAQPVQANPDLNRAQQIFNQ